MLATDERLTTGQAARAAGVSEQTIRQWLKAGALQYEQTPLGRLIDARSLGRLLTAREATRRARTTLPGDTA